MKNPLRKRIKRELKGDISKYIVLFLFLVLSIGFISGFLVAGNSMIKSYNESFEKYNVENGYFDVKDILTEEQIADIEKLDISLYKEFYSEQTEDGNTLRLFKNRDEVDKVCLMTGEMPKNDNEIALDRMYSENNDISVGDTIKVGEKNLLVTGYIALPDYSCLFQNNSDSMFDSVKFGVAVVSDKTYEEFEKSNVTYRYVWKYENEPENDIDEKKIADNISSKLATTVSLEVFVPRYLNQAINFTGSDLGKDKSMMATLLYIVIAIIAFMFAVTTSNSITKEAGVIGTLRASGYKKSEIILHYITLPILVTLVASVLGNVLGYTVFKTVAASMYYGSYSLTTYTTLWNLEAFIKTTIVPFIITTVLNFVIIARKLQFSPLEFLRRDLSRKKRKKAIKLPHFKFITRFRLRILIQNISGYVILLIGIIFANVLLLFGMMMTPLLNKYQDSVYENKISNYQYILNLPVETTNKDAEIFTVYELDTTFDSRATEEVTVYGIVDASKYIDIDFGKESLKLNEIFVSSAFAEKYSLKEGETVRLKERYDNQSYNLIIAGIYDYPLSLSVFMPYENEIEKFDMPEGFFNGYFSDTEISDIDEKLIATKITEDDLSKLSRQLKVSMGEMFYLFDVFSIILYMLLLFILAKLVIEKNQTSISMVKILGYDNKEIKKLYMRATSIAVFISLIISIPLSAVIIRYLYFKLLMQTMSGWLTFYIAPWIYPAIFVIGFLTYLLIEVIIYRKIKKIPMDEALKNVE